MIFQERTQIFAKTLECLLHATRLHSTRITQHAIKEEPSPNAIPARYLLLGESASLHRTQRHPRHEGAQPSISNTTPMKTQLFWGARISSCNAGTSRTRTPAPSLGGSGGTSSGKPLNQRECWGHGCVVRLIAAQSTCVLEAAIAVGALTLHP